MKAPLAGGFTTTNWSLVLALMDSAPARALDASERLCSRYWFPVYAFVRRLGNDVHQAEDLTQGFFEYAIQHQVLQRARREKGRFRSFLLSSLTHFLHNEHDRSTAAKRGGGCRIIPLDGNDAESLLAREPVVTASSPDSFDRRWAATLIRRVMENLRVDFARRGKESLHDTLLPFLTRAPSPEETARICREFSMEANTLRVTLHRFRHRFGELLRSEVAHTVASPEEVREEIRYLLSVMADH